MDSSPRKFWWRCQVNEYKGNGHPGLPNATVLSVSTSFVVPFAPKRVFDSLRDHKFRKEVCIHSTHQIFTIYKFHEYLKYALQR